MTIEELLQSLRKPLPFCPYSPQSPHYRDDSLTDKPCFVCGGLPEGPDLCRSADTRILEEAAATISSLAEERDGIRAATIEECAKLADDHRPDGKPSGDDIDDLIADMASFTTRDEIAVSIRALGAQHASDWAANNAPALPVGQCDCGATETLPDAVR